MSRQASARCLNAGNPTYGTAEDTDGSSRFRDDRYDAALLELVKAKMKGRKITPPKALEPTKPPVPITALSKQARTVAGCIGLQRDHYAFFMENNALRWQARRALNGSDDPI